jgi:hypothetical protein
VYGVVEVGAVQFGIKDVGSDPAAVRELFGAEIFQQTVQ